MIIIRNKPEVLFNLSKIERVIKELKKNDNLNEKDREKIDKKSA